MPDHLFCLKSSLDPFQRLNKLFCQPHRSESISLNGVFLWLLMDIHKHCFKATCISLECLSHPALPGLVPAQLEGWHLQNETPQDDLLSFAIWYNNERISFSVALQSSLWADGALLCSVILWCFPRDTLGNSLSILVLAADRESEYWGSFIRISLSPVSHAQTGPVV